jgi:hypothetical protein
MNRRDVVKEIALERRSRVIQPRLPRVKIPKREGVTRSPAGAEISKRSSHLGIRLLYADVYIKQTFLNHDNTTSITKDVFTLNEQMTFPRYELLVNVSE